MDLYVVYLRAFAATLAKQPLPVLESPEYKTKEEAAQHAIAVAIGAEDAVGWKANAEDTEDAEDGTLGMRARYGFVKRAAGCNAAEPPPDDEDDAPDSNETPFVPR